MKADQVICGFNFTRAGLNRRILTYHGFGAETYPTGMGEKLICLKNDHGRKLFNGQFVVVETGPEMPIECVDDHHIRAFVRPEDEPDREPVQLDIYRGHFENAFQYDKDRLDDDVRIKMGLNEIDWGYAITCHKAQGSEWGKVVVIDDGLYRKDPDQRRRWLYTAVTRAADRLALVDW